MTANDPLMQSFLKSVGSVWPLVIVIGAIAWAWLTGTSLIGLIAAGAKHLHEFGMNFGVRTLALIALCAFGLIVTMVLKNIANAPDVARYFGGVTGSTAPTPAPVSPAAPAAAGQIGPGTVTFVYTDWRAT